MSIFSSSKPKLAIVFDVGSSSVGVGGFLLAKNQKPRLVYSSRNEMVFQETVRLERFVPLMIETLEKTAMDISKVKFPPHSERTVSCFVASPWYASQTRISKKTFGGATDITEKLLQEMYDTESKAFRDQEKETMGTDVEIFETENIQVKLNGYETGHPYGKRVTEVQIALYIATASSKTLSLLKETIRKHLSRAKVAFYAFPFSAFSVTRDFFHEKMFLFLDISGEVTDISVVKDNVLEVTASFPKGKNFLLRALSQQMNVSPEEAQSLFRMHKNEMLHDESTKRVSEALSLVGEEWMKGLQETFRSITPAPELLPHDVFITADEDVSLWFVEKIQDKKFSQFTLGGDVFTVRYLNAPFLSSFCESDTKVERDPFLIIEGVFLSRFLT